MKVAFFEALEDILQSTSFTQIREKFIPFYDDVKRGCVDFTSSTCVRSSSDLESLWIMRDNNTSALKIRRPNHAKSKLALAKVLHSVTHIEASAIILALDACYRFRDMPLAFYMDWLSVADEELKHFGLLEELLGELDSVYGAFPVHNTLFEAMQATQASLEWRMGVVHRGLEAKGLDANPFVLQKLMQTNLPLKSKIAEVFEIILRDEVGHVQKGDIWWKYAQQDMPTPQPFVALCERFEHFSLAGKILNVDARLQAGFSIMELESLQAFYAKQRERRLSRK
ncbi:ferritin-like domain-containing protein [uncultured Helicobacter sp.]|uniref:ferritin-like domain-containing protein n=1 Tax=uncultured Helicobacter sp. TaxID=175537 RepID=UPI00374F8E20